MSVCLWKAYVSLSKNKFTTFLQPQPYPYSVAAGDIFSLELTWLKYFVSLNTVITFCDL